MQVVYHGGSRSTGMPIYELAADKLTPLSETSFEIEGVRERSDLQRLLRDQIDIIAPDTYVIVEEFGDWEDSRRRIDLLCIDREANLVVVELKRDEVGAHMELQAIRYAAMVSAMTFGQLVNAHTAYLRKRGREDDAQAAILDFLGWAEPDETSFAKSVRLVLASAEFSKELMTSVLWLNAQGLDITCVRLRPYSFDGRVLLDVQQVIPLPEAAEYQVQIREKARQERVAREISAGASRELAKYDVTVNGAHYESLGKARAIHAVVQGLCAAGVAPDEIALAIRRLKSSPFYWVEGDLTGEEFRAHAARKATQERRSFDTKRWFLRDGELIYTQGRTYAFSTQWGTETEEALQELRIAFAGNGVAVERRS